MTSQQPTSSRSVWEERPVKALIWLLIALAVVGLYQGAQLLAPPLPVNQQSLHRPEQSRRAT